MERRTPTNYAVTREQKRYVAKEKMKAEGKRNFCKHSYSTLTKGRFQTVTRNPSYFAEHWREYAEVD